MPIEFRCSECDSLLRTPDGSGGQTAQCPRCGARMPIPGPPSAQSRPGGEPSTGEQADVGRASPFAAAERGEADQANPYASPSAYGMAPGADMVVDQAAAAARVSGPATALLVMGFLGLPWLLLGIAMNAAQIFLGNFMAPFQPGAQDMPPALQMFSGAFGVLSGIVSLALTIVMIIGALKMKRLEHYGWAMAAAIIAVIPCFASCCCFLEVPFGIWALVVLSDQSVKTAFRA